MGKDRWVDDSLTIANQEIAVRCGQMRQTDLCFYTDNPRVYSILNGDEEASQAEIERRLGAMEHVKALVQSIKANGGLTDPVLVRDGDLVVLEGNSRLAAYRLLAKGDPIRWGTIKVKLLPSSVSDDVVFALLGEYHIIGRKDWAPYEQAGYLWRRCKVHGFDASRIASEMGLSAKTVSHLIAVYSYMKEHEDNDVARWSYYDELLKSQHIRKVRRADPTFDRVIVQKIRSGEIPRAIDVREKVIPICRAGGKTLATFVGTKGTLNKCYERAVSRGATNEWVNRLKKFREQICDPDARDDFQEMSEDHLKKCVYELRKIRDAVSRLVARFAGS
jgi:hypothetical protein